MAIERIGSSFAIVVQDNECSDPRLLSQEGHSDFKRKASGMTMSAAM